MKNGWTLPEALIGLCLVGLSTAIATPRLASWQDRAAVRRAAAETAAFYAAARYGAVMRGTRVRVEFTPMGLAAFLEHPRDSLFLSRPGPAADGVTMNVTRAVVRLQANGMALGGSNTTLVFQRGGHEERITISRLGRLKQWR